MAKVDHMYSFRLDDDYADSDAVEWDAETLYASEPPVVLDLNQHGFLPGRQGSLSGDAASVSVAAGPSCFPLAAGRSQGRGFLSNSMALVTMMPRITAAHRELAMIRRSHLPMPLLRQKKILNDLLEITSDDVPMQMRKTALKFLHVSFEYLVSEIFAGAIRRLFLKALKDLCSEEMSFAERKEGSQLFYYLTGAGANVGNKTYALEYEDCRMISQMLRTATIPSLKLAVCAYFWLITNKYEREEVQPISESEHRELCLLLADLTRYPYPLLTRRDAMDWLWRFEARIPSLTVNEHHEIWTNILDISELEDPIAARESDATSCLAGIRRLWWYSSLRHWTMDMAGRQERQHKVGMNLMLLMDRRYSHSIRTQAFELVALFSNLPHWVDMYEMSIWRTISDHFAELCLNDTARVNKEDVKRRATSLLARSNTLPTDVVTTRREMQLTRRSSLFRQEFSLITAAANTVRRIAGPETSAAASLENLSVFILTGESILVQKDQQAILYERICDYARLDATRDLAVSAMCALITIQDWLSAIRFAMGPSDED